MEDVVLDKIRNIVIPEGDYRQIKNILNKENDFYYKDEILKLFRT